LAKLADLLPGTLDLLILKCLATGPLHGYAVIQRIQQRSGNLLNIEQGSLYPALYRLEHAGVITSEWGTSETNRRAKFYSLTPEGRKRLRSETQDWNLFAQAVGNVLASEGA
jgi:PadR family transcriptional regulator, regulatory protein PadR